MKTTILTFAISLAFVFQSIGQINPIQNLTWSQWYEDPYNFFILQWDEPETPHDDLIGYNIYGEGEFLLFIDETSIYNIESIYGIISNCGGESFLNFNDGFGFTVYVTAVYNPGPVESDYTETIFVEGPALDLNSFKNQKPIIYPNPSQGVVTIGNKNVDKINVYNIAGKPIKEFKSTLQIDLSDISKGLYIIKLFSEGSELVSKLILE